MSWYHNSQEQWLGSKNSETPHLAPKIANNGQKMPIFQVAKLKEGDQSALKRADF
jgi:hypothetical protein